MMRILLVGAITDVTTFVVTVNVPAFGMIAFAVATPCELAFIVTLTPLENDIRTVDDGGQYETVTLNAFLCVALVGRVTSGTKK